MPGSNSFGEKTEIEVAGNWGINIKKQAQWCSIETCSVIEEMKRRAWESCEILQETHVNPETFQNNHIKKETENCEKTWWDCIVMLWWCKK